MKILQIAILLLAVLGCAGNPTGYDVLDLYEDTGACLHEVTIGGFGSATHARGDAVTRAKHGRGRGSATKSRDKAKAGGGALELSFDLTGSACEKE